MADIELVIKIPTELYDLIQNKLDFNGDLERKDIKTLMLAVDEGTPLPKGHGRIGDLDELIKTMKERNDDNGGEPLNAVDRGYDLAYQHMVKEAEECVIIEADTESEVENGKIKD